MTGLDTNILVRLANRSDPELSAVTQAIARLHARGSQLVVVNQVLFEFWGVVTRPAEANGLGATPAQAREEIERYIELFNFVPDPPLTTIRWLCVAEQNSIAGARIHDMRLALTYIELGIEEILTLNQRDFRGINGLRVLTPSDIVPA